MLLMVIAGTEMAKGQGENIIIETTSVKFFGVDFSEVKVYGAKESPAQLLQAFEDINRLFLSEPDKYNFEKLLNRRVSAVSIKAANSVIDYIDREDLIIEDSSYRLDDATIAEVVKFLPVDKEEGVGVVMVAEMLDKTVGQGFYVVVYFSLENKEILGSFRASGKAGGFGLRNYWANTIYNILRKR